MLSLLVDILRGHIPLSSFLRAFLRTATELPAEPKDCTFPTSSSPIQRHLDRSVRGLTSVSGLELHFPCVPRCWTSFHVLTGHPHTAITVLSHFYLSLEAGVELSLMHTSRLFHPL